MAVPATTGQLRTRVEDMQVGDYIVCSAIRKSSVAATNIFDLGLPKSISEIPYFGLGTTAEVVGIFYFIKVNKGLLIADRGIFNSISWDQLNAAKLIEGAAFESTGVIRALSGGVSFADRTGGKATSDQGFGAFPIINEWDRYIVNFPNSKINNGQTLDDVFHYSNTVNWCKETPIVGASGTRVIRGINSVDFFGNNVSSTAVTIYAYRPVFEYKEV